MGQYYLHKFQYSLQKVWAPQLKRGKIGSPNWKKTFLSDMSHENIENLVRRPIDQQETIETQNMLLNTQEHPLTQNFGNPSWRVPLLQISGTSIQRQRLSIDPFCKTSSSIKIWDTRRVESSLGFFCGKRNNFCSAVQVGPHSNFRSASQPRINQTLDLQPVNFKSPQQFTPCRESSQH